ncbi:MAG: DNA polymerase III subunit delta [Alphaproteobacteria bacterium]|nr:DNA polymerase III subunit delta [Alphaproteobacteria bacterium]
MKLAFRDIEPFVKKPNPAARVILVYGPDSGLMKERAKTMGLSIVDDINDPFNAVTISTSQLSDDPARLSDEANAMSMMGGQRLIRVEDASDKLTTYIKAYLESPNDSALIILEAGELGPRSSLRKLCEKENNAAAIPCYVEDERDLSRLIRETVQGANLGIEPDAVGWLATNISGNRQKARSELDKLITYKGKDHSPVTLAEAMQACGESGAAALDEFVYAVAGSQSEKALRLLAQINEEGIVFMVTLRSLQNHFRKLHLTRAAMEQGEAVEIAMKKLQPPIFFKQQNAFKAQINRFSLNALSQILDRLNTLESQCKQTGAPVETLCAQTVLGISMMKRTA